MLASILPRHSALASGSSAAPATPSGVAELAEKISALQVLIERSSARANTGAPQAPEKPTAGTLDFVLSTRAHGKIHRRDPYMKGVTYCGWAWAKCGQPEKTAESTLDFVLSTRAHGKIHRKDPYMAGVTFCGWAWAKCG